MKKKSKKVFKMLVQLTLRECPEGRYFYTVAGCKGKILRIKPLKGKYVVDVEFKADSMIELMVACDDRIISKTLQ